MARKTKTQTSEPAADIKKPAQKKPVRLKQWIVTALDEKLQRFHTFLLATCALKAREYFSNRYEKATIISISQSAESEKDASWLEDHSPFYD